MNEKTAKLVGQWRAEELPFLEEEEANRCDTVHVMVERNKRGQTIGYRAFQPHMHVLLTLRKIHPTGFDRYRETLLNRRQDSGTGE